MLISVTIPAFKKKFLAEAIESVLNQTYSDFELIILDDCSPENLISIVRNYNDERVAYYRNEKNCGALNVVDNWNKCLGYAKGDYVICMGDDDRLCPNCLEEYSKIIKTYPGLGAYQAWTEIIDENGIVFDKIERLPEYESVWSHMWHNWHGRGQYIGNILFDTELLRKNGGFYKLPMALASDEISTYIAIAEKGLANSQLPIFQYRKSRYTITNNGNPEYLMEALKTEVEWYYEFLQKHQPTDEKDIIYKEDILKEFSNKFRRKKRAVVYQNIYGKTFGAYIHWLSKYRRYGLSLFDMAIIFVNYIRKKKLY